MKIHAGDSPIRVFGVGLDRHTVLGHDLTISVVYTAATYKVVDLGSSGSLLDRGRTRTHGGTSSAWSATTGKCSATRVRSTHEMSPWTNCVSILLLPGASSEQLSSTAFARPAFRPTMMIREQPRRANWRATAAPTPVVPPTTTSVFGLVRCVVLSALAASKGIAVM